MDELKENDISLSEGCLNNIEGNSDTNAKGTNEADNGTISEMSEESANEETLNSSEKVQAETNETGATEISDTEDLNDAEENKIDYTNEFSTLNDKIDQLSQLFAQKIQHTEYEEKIVDQMHRELQKYKEDMYAQLVRPILLDIIEVRNSIMKMSKLYETKPEEEQSIPLREFSGYALDLEDILDRNNVFVYDSEVGSEFIPLKHKAIKKENTSEEAMHGKIAGSLSSGYEYNGKTISPEKVIVYVYQKEEAEGDKENG